MARGLLLRMSERLTDNGNGCVLAKRFRSPGVADHVGGEVDRGGELKTDLFQSLVVAAECLLIVGIGVAGGQKGKEVGAFVRRIFVDESLHAFGYPDADGGACFDAVVGKVFAYDVLAGQMCEVYKGDAACQIAEEARVLYELQTRLSFEVEGG